jgi:hypothetical protein
MSSDDTLKSGAFEATGAEPPEFGAFVADEPQPTINPRETTSNKVRAHLQVCMTILEGY